ncbi:hypothetical protein N7462_007850 [Penicillium macrosclerotiorum]|uniref:uncharacterized protein n=1 Tax=Penicillium macrosclerotiorum TaxID=303699 RepID=UPI0025484030|nr:uncharacterized protein N7462_007850 [Penicillium macrosclerotiorum]KAJ5679606.1 hypothetical protein N7462_007850 [Penicillium macrosclerotiorum]
MCGRYALGVRMAYIRQQFQDRGMQVDEAPEDDEVRETYNFPPGSFGAVYRADVPDHDHSGSAQETEQENRNHGQKTQQKTNEGQLNDNSDIIGPTYKLQSMKWGLVPFWTKRQPDYGSMMRTINCRDDSLADDRGMWTTMKKRKRCIVICQGFYEWQKKGPGGKEKVPHFVRRKDGDLMCFAGLWDCVKYEDAEEKLYTYTVITTSSSSSLSFLHDRMPVIMDYGSKEMMTWLDPNRKTWSKELQAILQPYEGELDCYPVSKEVGKVGNNSPDFIIPVNSKENKNNIANFFSNAKANEKITASAPVKKESGSQGTKIEHKGEKSMADHGIKREYSPESVTVAEEVKKQKAYQPSVTPSPQKSKMRSSLRNTPLKKPKGAKPSDGSKRITSFFTKK